MKANDMIREEISAFADGELARHRCDEVARKLRQPAEQDCWNLYHQIGDALRSDDLENGLSAGFLMRLTARIDLEPAIISRPAETHVVDPKMVHSHVAVQSMKESGVRWTAGRKFFVPGLAAAAAVVYLGLPKLMIPTNSVGSKPSMELAVQSGDGSRQLSDVMVVRNSDSPSPERVEVLRDAQMDEYMLAHQQFSPSLYSSAQFARSATFATNTGK
ncbi:sigma-E factor negative regulatory protein [Actimicrobium sp. CCI2.3]|uniref:sigma-E factor negative regulatory protein n=1 Tax=Actimicrobium sp. CCI2.3 TaxID=3048616 RepID=UPI002AB516F1|nr:sigma-E factor negative regulatory protein [Actimicrobium sp. CCI2.3]MDY7575132.1 sigma-E factor negative regulatory protein [Actimicrobium sp. CCI2.3]MEB0023615.1 sigma-E factor negative regulatory protein [Actimicrobium sp. CCI2.3]